MPDRRRRWSPNRPLWSPYGRRTERAPGSVLPAEKHGDVRAESARNGEAAHPTYYGRPAVKRSHYGWIVASYLFIGGLAGSAQVIATLADVLGGRRDRALVRGGRYVALIGALISPVFLIADLHARSRWYNMLRIFRPTSPMSIGSWTLFTFGTLSGLVATGQMADDLFGVKAGRTLARWFGVPAAGAGALMSVYTGTLLAATSTPLWAVGDRVLPGLFGATALSTAAGALTLIERSSSASPRTERRLAWISIVGAVAQIVLSRALEKRWREAGLTPVVEQPAFRTSYQGGVLGLGMVLPLLLQVLRLSLGERAGRLSTVAAITSLLGGYAERRLILAAGNRSADRPELYFSIAQAEPTAVPASQQRGAPTPAETAVRGTT
ncbi:MAG: NrfD/PsrC family molybdoenzyme membrane anchor subunit [Chloroflexota bacterium]